MRVKRKKEVFCYWPCFCLGIICCMLIYLLFLFQWIFRQNLILLGVIEKSVDPEKAIQMTNCIFDMKGVMNLYQRGYSLVKKAGYEKTYKSLFFLPYQNIVLFFVIFSIILICGIILIQKIQNNSLKNETEKVLMWMSDDKHIMPEQAFWFYSERLIESIENMKERLSRQKMIHLQDNERIMRYMEDISHQLKTPLSVIRVICEKMDIKHPEFSDEMEKCLWQVDRMTEMIRDLIKLGKFDCGRFKINFEQVPIKTLIETVVNDMEVLADRKGISIEVQGNADAPWFCDAFWMREIIENILKNCIEQSTSGIISIQYEKKECMNQIIIRDNGQGFIDGREKKIFERYFLGDRTKEGGSGLGLSIAQQATQLHFGTITASNRENGGAEFRIVFPQMDTDTIYNSLQ